MVACYGVYPITVAFFSPKIDQMDFIIHTNFMINAYLKSNHLKPELITEENPSLLLEALWIDVFCPSKKEELLLEAWLKLNIPSREEMLEIEISNRLYTEQEAIYMTANILSKSESIEPKIDAITIMNANDQLITVRYVEASAFNLFISRLPKLKEENYHALDLTIELLDATVDRLADVLERIATSLDKCSQTIFRPQVTTKGPYMVNYKHLLQEIGSNGDLCTKAGESLVTFNLLLTYFARIMHSALDVEQKSKLTLLEKDVQALSNHIGFLSNKVNFLLDATLGMVTIEQNAVIKIFSIAAVMFMPPTLIASIYGMNFNFMPELNWYYGYPLAIGFMMLSAWVPYKILQKKNWL